MVALLLVLLSLTATVLSLPLEQRFVSVTQDTLGNYKLQYDTGDSSRTEERSEDGTVIGRYTYLDGNGIPQTIEYTAGIDGFHATGGELPLAPLAAVEIPEVAIARTEHLAPGLEFHAPLTFDLELPSDTPEVAEAKAKHFAAHAAARASLLL